jgi:sec-independent protein translocase protein TatA
MIGNILSPAHLLLVLGVALLVLGPKRLPEVGRGLGSAIRDFRGSLSGADLTGERPALEDLSEPDRAAVASPPDRSVASRPEDADAR